MGAAPARAPVKFAVSNPRGAVALAMYVKARKLKSLHVVLVGDATLPKGEKPVADMVWVRVVVLWGYV